MHRVPLSVLLSVGLLILGGIPAPARAADEAKPADKIKALIVDGQNNHNWKATTPVLKAALESCGLFTVDVATTPQDKKQWDSFKPDFSKYGVVVSNYNGDDWPEPTKKAFEDFVRNGGGFVAVHAANNSFPNWPEYNKMIGVGGWGGRNAKSGPMLLWRNGKIERVAGSGGGGSHGPYHEFPVDTRDADHPITKGLPARWMHTGDELYATLRGPGENVKVLATAHSAKGGPGEHEPMLMVIDYGRGRVFHTTLGHDVNSMKCVGFATTLCRGAEWAATGGVTQKVPDNFPTADNVSKWEPPAGKR